MSGLLRALAFLTALGGSRRPDPGALVWFPVVGGLVGAVLGVVWWGAGNVWPPLLAAAVVVAVDLAVTGMLHADGLVDAGDGLIAPLDRERRLAVMAAPDAGAFGVATLVACLLVRVAALAALAPSAWLLAAVWGTARLVMAVVVVSVPYARASGGLASAFLAPGARPWAALWIAPLVALAVVHGVPAGPVAVAAVLVGGGAVVALARRRIGGFTGDVLGAACVVGETAGLVAAAVRW